MAILNKQRLKQYLDLNYNVLFSGKHGVGKTSVITEVFSEANLRWKYFSAATLDPWVDFVGIPKVIEREVSGVGPHGNDTIKQNTLELVRPGFIENDEVDAIFFDEFNRAPSKVINAVMELIQFKSINGHKLNNLKVIWAAINPEDEDDTYSVNHLDPAHIDRFHAQLEVPFEVDREYFKRKYPSVANAFLDWWRDLPSEIKLEVSPRRLDYAAHAWLQDCRIEDFLPRKSNPKKLRDLLKSQPFALALSQIKTEAEAEVFLKDINNTTRMLDLIKAGDTSAVEFFEAYGKKVPEELVEPFVEWLTATKAQQSIIASNIEEFIKAIPGDKGNAATAAVINYADFGMFYRGNSKLANMKLIDLLENDLRALHQQKTNVTAKLVNRIVDIVLTCKPNTLMRAYWGIKGREDNTPTNLHMLTELCGKIPGLVASTSAKKINEKLYQSKVIDSMHWLPTW